MKLLGFLNKKMMNEKLYSSMKQLLMLLSINNIHNSYLLIKKAAN